MTLPCVESNITVFHNVYYELLIKIKYLNPNDAAEGQKKPRKSEKRNTIRKDIKAVPPQGLRICLISHSPPKISLVRLSWKEFAILNVVDNHREARPKPVRLKARGLAQRGTPPGWLDEGDFSCDGRSTTACSDGPYCLPRPGTAQLWASGDTGTVLCATYYCAMSFLQ